MEAAVNKTKVALFWSGGKDAAYSLYLLSKQDAFKVSFLVTTLNANYQRVSMHGVRENLIEQQAKALNLPLKKMWMEQGTNEEYEKKLDELFHELKRENIHHVAFGDIFLTEIRSYREKILERNGMKGLFPVWGMKSEVLLAELLDAGFKAVVCCVDANVLSPGWVGAELDEEFMKSLPAQVDCCGENGEFHTFVYDGPMFSTPIHFKRGEKISRPHSLSAVEENPKTFCFIDLVHD
jgi:uncharacterized protein (TIGR00290 family)